MIARKLSEGLLVLFCAFQFQTFAQEVPSCPSDDINDELLQNNVQFSRSFAYFEQVVQQQLALSAEERTDDIYIIPVVVHVIHEGEPVGTGSNISDAQIFSAIEAINNDFRKINGTNGDGDGVDVGIEFCLAVRDANGNSTTGINRVNGSVITDYADEGIEATGGVGADEAAVKALSTWPREEYMNVWIVNEIENNNAGSGIQGYAYFPVDSPLDGLVILHNAFGTVGNIKVSTNLNRTFTHEAGHYFALYHTFHNTTTCNVEGNCSTGGDKVCDTPVTPLQSQCNSPACSGTQQVENYMDYTSELCRNMYTEGQKVRMRATLLADRASLTTSLGCIPVTELDCGISSINSPSGSSCQQMISPQVMLTNYGSDVLTSCIVHYNIDGVGNFTFSWAGNLASATSTTVNLPSMAASVGTHQYIAWTSAPNGASDDYAANDQLSEEFSITTGSTAQVVTELDFFGTDNTWEIVDSLDVVVESGGPFTNGDQGTIITENICLPAGCYTLIYYDDYGDGQTFTYGDFTLLNGEGDVLAFETGDWDDEISNDFCLEETIVIGVPPVTSFNIGDQLVCKNGTVDFTDTSSEFPIQWTWNFEGGIPSSSSSQHPQNISYPNAGSYDVTLTATNETGSTTYTCVNCVTVSAGPTVTLTDVDVTCFGSNNGSISSVVTGGNSPYGYSWNTGQTSSSINSLSPATYTLTVTDEDGCVKTQTATITQPTSITVSATITNVSCNGGTNGSISASASGGTGAYTYTWNTGNSGALLSNKPAGSYTLTVTDGALCQKVQTYSISQPNVLQVNLTDDDISCMETTGSASVNPSGGVSSYVVSWSNGASGNSVSGLAAGNYSVSVTDANSCNVSSTFVISQVAAMNVNATATNVLCNGGTSGQATCTVTGGNGDYDYDWSNGQSTATINNLSAGTYTLVVTDDTGCEGTDQVTISQPNAIALTSSATSAICFGDINGTVSGNASGGTGAFGYSWNTGSSGATLNNVGAGTYTVTATDANGCSATSTTTVTQPPAIIISASVLGTSCYGSADGDIFTSISGGTGAFTYSWNTGDDESGLDNKPAGTYVLIVTDAAGCEKEQSFVITQPAALATNIIDYDIACNTVSGSAEVTPSGGTAPYEVNWSNGTDGYSNPDLITGNYSVTITDAHDCIASSEFEITSSENLIVMVTANPTSCFGEADGTAEVLIIGGTGDYSIQWSAGGDNEDIDNLAVGDYSVNVSDDDGCTGFTEFTITEPDPVTLAVFKTDISCYGLTDGTTTATASGGVGGFEFEWSNGLTGSSLNSLPAGTIMVTASDANGCSESEFITIIEPSQMVANCAILQPETCDGSNGGGVVNVMGGTPGYTYLWSNGSSDMVISNVSAGVYAITVTDADNCIVQSVLEVPFECDVIIPTTGLIETDCNQVGFELDGTVYCHDITNAEMYKWKFTNATSGEMLTEEFTIDPGFMLSQVDGLTYGMSAYVQVKVLYDGFWGAYGDVCSIAIVEQMPVTALVDGDCGATGVVPGDVLTATMVAGASNYAWHIAGDNYDFVVYTAVNELEVTESLLFESGNTYSIEVKCLISGEWTDYGPICMITYGVIDWIGEITENGMIDVFPNPCDGERIFFDFGNLMPGDVVKDLEIFGPTGSLVEEIKLSEIPLNGLKTEYRFTHPLSGGWYVMHYTLNDMSSRKKILVR